MGSSPPPAGEVQRHTGALGDRGEAGIRGNKCRLQVITKLQPGWGVQPQ